MEIKQNDPLAGTLIRAIQAGDLPALQRLLGQNPRLATARVGGAGDTWRTLLHVATDWPGHFPNGPAIVSLLIAHGADLNARFIGPHAETPLHWAASTDDVAVLDLLLDAGADMEAPGAVIGGGTPLADAVAFGQWQAARRLVARGAKTTLWQAAALGLMDRVEAAFAGGAPAKDEVTNALWCACHGGQREVAAYLLAQGAERNWVGYDGLTPLDAALRSGAAELAAWLREQGAKLAHEM